MIIIVKDTRVKRSFETGNDHRLVTILKIGIEICLIGKKQENRSQGKNKCVLTQRQKGQAKLRTDIEGSVQSIYNN